MYSFAVYLKLTLLISYIILHNEKFKKSTLTYIKFNNHCPKFITNIQHRHFFTSKSGRVSFYNLKHITTVTLKSSHLES